MKGILFNDAMLKAWHEGRKDVTRRLMKPQPDLSLLKQSYLEKPKEWRRQHLLGPGHRGYDKNMWLLFNVDDPVDAVPYYGATPPYRPGERVYIKETCYICGSDTDGAPLADPPVVYAFDGARKSDEYPHVRSSMLTPEWAARSHALVKSVRPERVREITEEDARREGVEASMSMIDGMPPVISSYIDSFRRLWETLYPGSWSRNDFVWRYELQKED